MIEQILFHALKEDLLPVLEAVERDGPLKYVRTGNFTRPNYEVFAHGAEIPELGKATTDSSASCESFLVLRNALPVNVRHMRSSRGGDRFLIDQLANEDTVTFSPGGMWGKEVVIEGAVTTVSDTAASQELMRRFHSAIKKRFVKVKAFWVGPKALALLRAGKRLTLAVQCPREFDLTIGP